MHLMENDIEKILAKNNDIFSLEKTSLRKNAISTKLKYWDLNLKPKYKAMASACIPGLGQLINRQYVKMVIVMALFALLLYAFIVVTVLIGHLCLFQKQM